MVQAKLTRDIEIFGKQDPYVTMKYGGIKHRTSVHEGGGMEPVWNNEFDIELGSISDDIMLSVKDKEMMGSKLIGSANVKASAFCINNGVRDWFTFDFDGKSIG